MGKLHRPPPKFKAQLHQDRDLVVLEHDTLLGDISMNINALREWQLAALSAACFVEALWCEIHSENLKGAIMNAIRARCEIRLIK